jgi:hypothetical protein
MKLLDFATQTFGFINLQDFLSSMTNKNLFPVLLSVSAVLTFASTILGIEVYTIGAIVVALGAELVTGLWASILVLKEKPDSERFARFGLKAFIWFMFVYIANALNLQYVNHWMGTFWEHTHIYLVTYITLHYLISIDENVAVILGGEKDNTILKKVLNQAYKLLPSKSKSDENKDNKNSDNN